MEEFLINHIMTILPAYMLHNKNDKKSASLS